MLQLSRRLELSASDPSRHPLFDTQFYLERYPDVAESGVNPLTHYVLHGAKEGRDPHPLFDTRFYLEKNPSVAASGMNPLAHYVLYGAKEGFDPHPLFDTTFYLKQNPDLAVSDGNPLIHFIRHGAGEEKDPNPWFETQFYLATYSDVVISGMNPLIHYCVKGWIEAYAPSRNFEPSFYLEQLTVEEMDQCKNPLVHYLRIGKLRGLQPNRGFIKKVDLPIFARIVSSVANDRPTVLIVLHNHGGGTKKHVCDLVDFFESHANFLILSRARQSIGRISVVEPRSGRELEFNQRDDWPELLRFLRACRVKRLHIHHVADSEDLIEGLVRDLALPFDFTVHDYHTITPTVHFPEAEDVENFKNSAHNADSQKIWRSRYAWLYKKAARVIVPTHDVERRVRSYIPDLKITVAAHLSGATAHDVRCPSLQLGSPLHIAVLGSLSVHKGLRTLLACAKLVKEGRNPLRFTVIGQPDSDGAELKNFDVTIRGRYRVNDVLELIADTAPHVLWYPGLAVETFSYTLSEGFEARLPIVVTDIGAFAERTLGRSWTWIVAGNTSPEEWIKFFVRIRNENFLFQKPPSVRGTAIPLTDEFYRTSYLDWTV